MIQLTDAAVIANNELIAITPNSLKYTEGFGEQTVRTASIGGGRVEQVFARNVESALSKLMFDIPATPENIALARTWKANGNQNVFQIAGETPEGNVTRTFTQAAVTNDYEVEVGTESNISIEIMANSAV